MDLQDKRKQIAAEVFASTGAKVDGYDPLVIAALFYSQQLGATGDAVAKQLQAAAADLRAASQVATAANNSLVADRAKLIKDIEAHVARCVKLASKGQSGGQDFRRIPLWHAVAGAVVGAIALSAGLMIGFERGSAQADDAAVGRSFVRVVPTMDAKLKQQLMEHLRKPSQ
jgi:hypothetical protein